MHRTAVSSSSHVHLPCGDEKVCILGVLHPLCPLHSFLLQLHRAPWVQEGGIRWKHAIYSLVAKFQTLYIVSSCEFLCLFLLDTLWSFSFDGWAGHWFVNIYRMSLGVIVLLCSFSRRETFCFLLGFHLFSETKSFRVWFHSNHILFGYFHGLRATTAWVHFSERSPLQTGGFVIGLGFTFLLWMQIEYCSIPLTSIYRTESSEYIPAWHLCAKWVLLALSLAIRCHPQFVKSQP